MGTTPIYSLTYPELSDLVTDGASDIQALATGIETMFDVYGGLKKIIPTGTHSGVTFDSRGNGSGGGINVDIGGCFTTAFNAYEVIVCGAVPFINNNLVIGQLLSTNVIANWARGAIYTRPPDTVISSGGSTSATGFYVSQLQNITGGANLIRFRVFNPCQPLPKSTESFVVDGFLSGTNATHADHYAYNNTTVTSTGLRLNSAGMSFTHLSIYGYNV